MRTLSDYMAMHPLGLIRQLSRRLPDVLPSSCALCGFSCNESVCPACKAQYFQHHPCRCLQCGVALSDTTQTMPRCGDCLRQQHKFDATVVATDYIAPIDQLVHALKFGHRLALAPLFCRMLLDAIALRPEYAMPTLLTVVPLSAARLQTRGFNQALEIAKPLAQALAIPLVPSLISRSRNTQMQALLHPAERHNNMRHAFNMTPAAEKILHGQHVGVVDDVMTTGETLNEIAATLKGHGAARVTNFVFARTPPR